MQAEFQPNWDCAAELTENSLAETAEQETLRCAAGNLEESLAAMLQAERHSGCPGSGGNVIAEDNSIEIEQVTVACRDAAAADSC